MALARFLQISDLHLGRPFAWLPPDRREQRRRDQQAALEHVVRHAIEKNAHAILIPGDLFDGVPVDTGSLAFATRAFGVSGCPPVLIAPGNHDPASNDNAAGRQQNRRVELIVSGEPIGIGDITASPQH